MFSTYLYTDLPEVLSQGNKRLLPIEAELSNSTVRCNSIDEVDTFVNLMHWFLKLNPIERPTAAQALDESVFKYL